MPTAAEISRMRRAGLLEPAPAVHVDPAPFTEAADRVENEAELQTLLGDSPEGEGGGENLSQGAPGDTAAPGPAAPTAELLEHPAVKEALQFMFDQGAEAGYDTGHTEGYALGVQHGAEKAATRDHHLESLVAINERLAADVCARVDACVAEAVRVACPARRRPLRGLLRALFRGGSGPYE